MKKYPNLELIEYIFKNKIHELYAEELSEEVLAGCTAEVFMQTWPNTATGFSEPGVCSGQAMTNEYTTIMMYDWSYTKDDNEWHRGEPIYGVFFGNRFGYAVMEPKYEFFEDWKKKNMQSVFNAKETY